MTSTLLMDSPVGTLRLCADAVAITEVSFVDERLDGVTGATHSSLLAEACRQLTAYFRGTRQVFELPLAPAGTDFQRGVWAELATIPFGATSSYGEIARRLGRSPGASRAVGTANGANPIAIVIPCHRVLGANGDLIGFGGGLERKRYLLRLESTDAHQGLLFG